MHLVSSGRTSLLSRTVCCFSTFSCKRAGSDIESLERRDSQMIQGYPDRPSVLPGGTPLTLHVSTDAPQFSVDFYRQGRALEFKQSSDWLPGQNLPSTFPLVQVGANAFQACAHPKASHLASGMGCTCGSLY